MYHFGKYTLHVVEQRAAVPQSGKIHRLALNLLQLLEPIQYIILAICGDSSEDKED